MAVKGTAATPGILILLGGAALLYWAIFDKNGVLNKFAAPPPVFALSDPSGSTGTPPDLTPGHTKVPKGFAVTRFNQGLAPLSPNVGSFTYAQQKAAFINAIAEGEGGYNSINPHSGAIGRYQILPAIWRSWAQKYLGNANAAPTPANQDYVVGKRIDEYYTNYNAKIATGQLPNDVSVWTRIAVAWSRGPSMAARPSWHDWNRHGYVYATQAIYRMAKLLGTTTYP